MVRAMEYVHVRINMAEGKTLCKAILRHRVKKRSRKDNDWRRGIQTYHLFAHTSKGFYVRIVLCKENEDGLW